jgi:hypothetical protein
MLRAIEIKSGNSYSPKDISNLRNFYESSGRKTTVSLVYQGTEYLTEGPVKIIPLAALHRGK